MNETIVEIEVPSFEELTKEKYYKIIDAYGEYQRKTIEKAKENDTYIQNLERENKVLRSRKEDLKEIITEIIERI